MPTNTPLLGWPVPTLTEQADNPAALMALGKAIEQTVGADDASPYTPAWTSAGTLQPGAAGTQAGYFRVRQGWCDVWITLTFTAATTGGNGNLSLGLPLKASANCSRQLLQAFTYCPGYAFFQGISLIVNNALTTQPLFPNSISQTSVGGWRSTDATNAVGTGIPLIPGSYPVRNTGYITVQGRYLVA